MSPKLWLPGKNESVVNLDVDLTSLSSSYAHQATLLSIPTHSTPEQTARLITTSPKLLASLHVGSEANGGVAEISEKRLKTEATKGKKKRTQQIGPFLRQKLQQFQVSDDGAGVETWLKDQLGVDTPQTPEFNALFTQYLSERRKSYRMQMEVELLGMMKQWGVHEAMKKMEIPELDALVAEKKGPESEVKCSMRARKIRFYPTTEQCRILDLYILATKKLWNCAIEHVDVHVKPMEDKLPEINQARAVAEEPLSPLPSFYAPLPKNPNRKHATHPTHTPRKLARPLAKLDYTEFQMLIVPNYSCNDKRRRWIQQVPSSIRQYAIRQFVENYNTCVSRMRAYQIKKFVIAAKDYSDRRNGCFKIVNLYTTVEAGAGRFKIHKPEECSTMKNKLSKDKDTPLDTVFPGWLKMKINAKDIPYFDFKHDMTVQKKNGKWFLIAIYKQPLPPPPSTIPVSICSIDPGVRTFATIYSPNTEQVLEAGTEDGVVGRKLKRMYERMAKLERFHDRPTYNAAQRKHKATLSRAIAKLRLRAENLVKDLHMKLGKFLATHFEHVLLPTFSSGFMKNVAESVKWKAKCLQHYAFRQRLIMQAEKHSPNTTIWLCTEEYTSKTCGVCGNIHYKLGASKTFVCPNRQCYIKGDRDALAARNIMLKVLTSPKKQQG